MNRFLLIIAGISLVTMAVLGIQCSKPADDETTQASRNKTLSKVVDIDELVRHPEDFKGFIGVRGTVTQVDESKTAFVLGCEDACVAMTVTFKGQMPAVGTEVTLYGEVTKAEGDRYIFAAQDIRANND